MNSLKLCKHFKHCCIDLYHLPQVSVFWSQYLAISQISHGIDLYHVPVSVFCNISWHWSSPQWLSPQPRFIWLHHGSARLANELLIVMNIEQAAVWEDTDDTYIVYCIVGGYRSFWRIITSVLITQIRLRRFNCSSHNSKYPGKSTFFSGDCVCIGYCVVLTIANIQLTMKSITGIDKYSTPTPHSACMTVGQL